MLPVGTVNVRIAPKARVRRWPLRPHGRLQKIPVGAPMDLVTMDILSGLPTALDGSKYLLVVVDAFTKWVEAYPLHDQEAATCITAVYSCRGGPAPNRLSAALISRKFVVARACVRGPRQQADVSAAG